MLYVEACGLRGCQNTDDVIGCKVSVPLSRRPHKTCTAVGHRRRDYDACSSHSHFEYVYARCFVCVGWAQYWCCLSCTQSRRRRFWGAALVQNSVTAHLVSLEFPAYLEYGTPGRSRASNLKINPDKAGDSFKRQVTDQKVGSKGRR